MFVAFYTYIYIYMQPMITNPAIASQPLVQGARTANSWIASTATGNPVALPYLRRSWSVKGVSEAQRNHHLL